MLFCCPSCALSERQQSGNAVRITAFTDFHSGLTLDPSGAFLVRGSNINPCTGHGAHLGSDKQPLDTHFDRCSPGLIAFGGIRQAQAFALEHGGQIIQFSDLVSAQR